MNVERKILIVDDTEEMMKDESISTYIRAIKHIKDTNNEKRNFFLEDVDIKFDWVTTINEAIEKMNDKKEIFDVVVIDYDFTKDVNALKGVDLVLTIRKCINKRCKIIFYTARGLDGFKSDEFISLINSNVFRFVIKTGENIKLNYERIPKISVADQAMAESIIEAVMDVDPIVSTLERFFVEYSELVQNMTIDVNGSKIAIKDMVQALRLDNEIGNLFVNTTLKAAILNTITYLE